MDGKRKVSGVWKILMLAGVLVFVFLFIIPSIAYTSDSYSGEFIRANKVYMPDNNIKLVIYFNESDNTKFVVFDDWDAHHSIILSNMAEGTRIEVFYKEYIIRDCKEIIRIELL